MRLDYLEASVGGPSKARASTGLSGFFICTCACMFLMVMMMMMMVFSAFACVPNDDDDATTTPGRARKSIDDVEKFVCMFPGVRTPDQRCFP
jgi:hypothetical protein